MKEGMEIELRVSEVASLVGAQTIEGEADGKITGIQSLEEASEGQLSFLSHGKYARFLETSRASVVLISSGFAGKRPEGQTWIRVENPSIALGRICRQLEEKLTDTVGTGIHPTAIVEEGAQIDPSCRIGPFCFIRKEAVLEADVVLVSHVKIGKGVKVGAGSYLHSGTVIEWGCRIGKNCRLHAGVVIGADGFGFHSDQSGHTKLPQIGIVVVGDSVEIGANSTIDRARFSSTRIGDGTKIDNQVQIGHNVVIGKHCIICSQCGLSGSSILEDFVIMAGQVGSAGHLTIGKGAIITGQTGVTKSVPAGATLSGTPGMNHREAMKLQALVKQLPAWQKRLKETEERLNQCCEEK